MLLVTGHYLPPENTIPRSKSFSWVYYYTFCLVALSKWSLCLRIVSKHGWRVQKRKAMTVTEEPSLSSSSGVQAATGCSLWVPIAFAFRNTCVPRNSIRSLREVPLEVDGQTRTAVMQMWRRSVLPKFAKCPTSELRNSSTLFCYMEQHQLVESIWGDEEK
jgi:hypothetical protein